MNMNKSSVFCGFVHIYQTNPECKTLFFVKYRKFLKNLTLGPILRRRWSLQSHKIVPKVLTILPVTENHFASIFAGLFCKYLQCNYIVLIKLTTAISSNRVTIFHLKLLTRHGQRLIYIMCFLLLSENLCKMSHK